MAVLYKSLLLLLTIVSTVLAQGSIPSRLSALDGSSSVYFGPNCFNASLVAAGLLGGIRHTTTSEFEFYLSSGRCRMLNDQEDLEPNDIQVMWMQMEKPYLFHSFTHLNTNQVFTKNGESPNSPYKVQSFKNMSENYYSIPAYCRQSNFQDNSECSGFFYSSYRCTTMNEFVKNDNIRLSLEKTHNVFLKLEDEMENWLIGIKDKISVSSWMQYFESIEKLNYSIVSSDHKYNEDELFLLQSILYRVEGIGDKVGYFPEFSQDFVLLRAQLRDNLELLSTPRDL
jgi:hypothetical protein